MSKVKCCLGQQTSKGEPMKDEYDFSNAERGKFYRPNLRLIPPVRLEPEVLDFLATRAKQRGTTVNQLVNQLLKKDIELIQAAAG
jgi:predicted HicB family RNase H-like nuclease